ncbi:hypothetical protein HPB48_001274 [Haemaphysalis longicornis]|uniref:Uncharacterized protein n=1 Tax=Haemaphysalis longicornis TaxID=44386 RepID=A0A9J6FHX8_HAELO|nr:hypothetical protein HPB48_001274 [Haemaphysalis longicornis]
MGLPPAASLNAGDDGEADDEEKGPTNAVDVEQLIFLIAPAKRRTRAAQAARLVVEISNSIKQVAACVREETGLGQFGLAKACLVRESSGLVGVHRWCCRLAVVSTL